MSMGEILKKIWSNHTGFQDKNTLEHLEVKTRQRNKIPGRLDW